MQSMATQLLILITALTAILAQEFAPNLSEKASKSIDSSKSLPENQAAENIPQIKSDLKQSYDRPQITPDFYGLAYLEPQYQAPPGFARIQPQLFLYGPGGQGQPILINPGNPPGNFLVPQGPGPNVILRNNPQGPGVVLAGYPKPAHIPPIEKDAEEIPTDAAKIPPLNVKPISKPKPEKLETLNENAIPSETERAPGNFNLRPGQRFFILNGNDLFNYPFQAEPESDALSALRYTNVQQNSPGFEGQFFQQPAQYSQSQENDPTGFQITQDLPYTWQGPGELQGFPIQHPEFQVRPQNQRQLNHELQGQFRYTPPPFLNFNRFRDDFENDAIVVEAAFDNPENIVGRGEKVKDVEEENTTPQETSPKESESSMAQAAPHATAIAGTGGVAGSAPRGTAIVGKGGLAVSSPQATAVAGTKDEEKQKKPVKKEV